MTTVKIKPEIYKILQKRKDDLGLSIEFQVNAALTRYFKPYLKEAKS